MAFHAFQLKFAISKLMLNLNSSINNRTRIPKWKIFFNLFNFFKNSDEIRRSFYLILRKKGKKI